MAPSPPVLRLLIVLFVALGSLTYGYSSSIIATTLGQPSFNKYFALDTRSDAANLSGAINALFQVGGLLGALSCIWSADWLGRRKAILVSALVTLVGGGLQAGSVHIGMYIMSRFITGLGIGLLVGMHGIMICVCYTSASWIGMGFYFVNASGAQWRLPLAIQCLPPLLLSCGIMYLPETPRWLIDHDRMEEAYASFKAVRAESSDTMLNDEMAIRSEFDLIRRQLLHEKQEAVSFIDLFKQPSLRKRCIIGWLTMFGAQGTATLVINMFGFAGSVVALISECITVSIFQKTGHRSAASAAVFFLFLHIGCFSSSVDATSYIYASEIFPTPVRAKGLAVSISGLFFATIIFLQCAPLAFGAIGWKYYLVFIVITTIIFFIMWFYFPETSKMRLEDIGEIFGDSVEPIAREDTKSEEHEEVYNEKQQSYAVQVQHTEEDK